MNPRNQGVTMKLFPFDPAKAQTITNPDGFPVFHADGTPATEVAVFRNGSVACLWAGRIFATTYDKNEAAEYLCLGPKPGKTVYLNCWWDAVLRERSWGTYHTEAIAKEQAALHANSLSYQYIAIPVTGPDIEP